MKKTIFTLNVDNYAPEITALTYPLLQRYAEKIGADFHVITERKHPDCPPVYEKMQIYDLAKQMGNDWSIYIDSDALVHPDTFDITEFLPKDTVCHNGNDMANNRWRYNDYFRRDGRHIGSCNWLTIASDWCRDLWHPLEIPYEEAVRDIFPLQGELNTIIEPSHLIDDYMLSRNIARFGLKFTTVNEIIRAKSAGGNYFWHLYTIPIKEKVMQMKDVISFWEVTGYQNPKIEGWSYINELHWLYQHAKDYETIVEVGSWKGGSAHALASGCRGQVHAVEDFCFSLPDGLNEGFSIPSPGNYNSTIEQTFRANTNRLSNITLIKKDSIAAAEQFEDGSVDMVYIDANHNTDDVIADLKAWFPKCKKMICGHDYDHPQVKEALFSFNLKPAQPWEKSRIWYVLKD
jgi:hypothetical protein